MTPEQLTAFQNYWKHDADFAACNFRVEEHQRTWQAACVASRERIITLEAELLAAHDLLAAKENFVLHDLPPEGSALRKLGARLAELLDEDQWAECEQRLFDVADEAKNETPHLHPAPVPEDD